MKRIIVVAATTTAKYGTYAETETDSGRATQNKITDMTKEEAINILQKVVDWKHDSLRGHPEMRYIAEAVEVILSQPSLPSNLDEAAENHMLSITTLAFDERDVILSFKAGAEWMAGQGWSRELEVKEDAGGYPYIDKHIELYDYDTDEPLAKKGDKVVVQIRKK